MRGEAPQRGYFARRAARAQYAAPPPGGYFGFASIRRPYFFYPTLPQGTDVLLIKRT